MKPKRQFEVNEIINHPKFGKGKILEVFEYKVRVVFEDGKILSFISALLEKNLVYPIEFISDWFSSK